MSSINSLMSLPEDLPEPIDDGACAHLLGATLPSVSILATDGRLIDLSALTGRTVLFAYPRTGLPGQPPLVDHWNEIPGARGCTPQTCGFRDLWQEFAQAGHRVLGLSTQSVAYQQELVQRLGLPFPVLSDADLRLCTALSLPTLQVAGEVLIRRFALVLENGRVLKVFYPVFPPDQNAANVMGWIRTGLM